MNAMDAKLILQEVELLNHSFSTLHELKKLAKTKNNNYFIFLFF